MERLNCPVLKYFFPFSDQDPKSGPARLCGSATRGLRTSVGYGTSGLGLLVRESKTSAVVSLFDGGKGTAETENKIYKLMPCQEKG